MAMPHVRETTIWMPASEMNYLLTMNWVIILLNERKAFEMIKRLAFVHYAFSYHYDLIFEI